MRCNVREARYLGLSCDQISNFVVRCFHVNVIYLTQVLPLFIPFCFPPSFYHHKGGEVKTDLQKQDPELSYLRVVVNAGI